LHAKTYTKIGTFSTRAFLFNISFIPALSILIIAASKAPTPDDRMFFALLITSRSDEIIDFAPTFFKHIHNRAQITHAVVYYNYHFGSGKQYFK